MGSCPGAEPRGRNERGIAEISQLFRQAAVEAVSGALGQGGASVPARRKTATRGPGRPKTGRKSGRPKGKRGRRSAADLEAQGAKILAQVRANPGARMEAITAALGAATKDLQRPVQELIASGQLRTEGQRRGTQYFVGGGKRKTTRKKGKATRRKAKKARRVKRKTAKKAA